MRITLIVLACLVTLGAGQTLAQRPNSQRPDSSIQHGTAWDGARPGDVVRLRIWREPDLSGEFVVDESGEIVFPKIGQLRVSDYDETELKSVLLKAYQVYLRNPSIDILLLRRVNVLGAVQKPGLYPVDATMTLADVIALAGGATPIGKPDEAQLKREGKTVTTHLISALRVGELHLQSGDQLFVPERSWFSRNSGVVAAALSASVSLIIALSR